jgi:low affinity Fe/Cu permease
LKGRASRHPSPQGKLDELIKSNEKARNEIAEMDDKEPEEIEEMRDSGERS